ncbi:MAG: alpha/beta fold hydrolase, partial [Chloroflexota bacterium]
MPTRHVPASPGIDIAVTEWPSPGNPPLLVLHGIGSCAQTWDNVAPALAERHHLYVLDHRGHGASAKPDTGYLLPDYAADLDAIIANLGIPDAHLNILGHSLGALITMTWAADNPGRARRILLEDPPLRMVPEILEAYDGWVQLNAMPPAQVAAWYA